MIIGLALVIIGILSLLFKEGILTAAAMGYIWPAVLILLGLMILVRRFQVRRYGAQVGCCCSPVEQPKADRQ